MTGRDRIVLIVVVVLAVLGGGWMLVVSPERKKADKLGQQVSSAKAELATADGTLASARAAQAQYAAAYSSIVNLGKAVPAEAEVPSLIYQLAQATNQTQVDFGSISSGSGATTNAATSGSASAATAAAGFTQMPFTFVFNGGFFDLEHLFNRLTAFTQRTSSGALKVSGRLLTVQSVKLTPLPAQGKETAAKPKSTLTGTITATAYQLPASQGVTAGASPSSPTGASTPASSTGAASSTTAPAIARVTP